MTCLVCGAANDANICRRHTRELEKAIGELPALLRELDVTISRQDRGTGTSLYATHRVQIPSVDYEEGTTTLPATPWVFAWDAADLRWSIESSVITWAMHVLESRDWWPDLPERGEGPTCADCGHASCERMRTVEDVRGLIGKPGRLLLRLVESIRIDEAAGQLYDEIIWCQRAATRAIDRQGPTVFLGRCDAMVLAVPLGPDIIPSADVCGADLMAHTGDDEAKCPRCGTVYDVLMRKRSLPELDDAWAPASVIAGALSTIDEPVNPSTLRTWIDRDAKLARRLALSGDLPPYPLILQRGIDDDGRTPLYRVGDVRARIAAAKALADTPTRGRKVAQQAI